MSSQNFTSGVVVDALPPILAACCPPLQRDLDERNAKLAALEERCNALEHEVDSVAHQLRTTEGKLQKQVATPQGMQMLF